ncbi:hypothetical protein OSTOST_12128 [Ostertagia ostertagi]
MMCSMKALKNVLHYENATARTLFPAQRCPLLALIRCVSSSVRTRPVLGTASRPSTRFGRLLKRTFPHTKRKNQKVKERIDVDDGLEPVLQLLLVM